MATTKKKAPKKSGKKATSKSKKTTNNKKKHTPNAQMYIKQEQRAKSQKQMIAVVIFAASIFNFALCFVKGGNAWQFLREILIGLFGVCAVALPLTLLYVAITTAMDKSSSSIGFNVAQAFIFTSLICSAVFIFSNDTVPADYLESIGNSYKMALDSRNGGAIGAIIGGAIMKLFPEKVTSGITIVLLLFIDIMIITGTTLGRLYKGVKKPVKKATEVTTDYFEKASREIEQRREQNKHNLDVDLGPSAEESSKSDIEAEMPTKTKKSKRSKSKSKFDVDLGAENKTIDDSIEKKDTDLNSNVEKEVDNIIEFKQKEEKAPEEPKPQVLLDDIIKKAATPKIMEAAKDAVSTNEVRETSFKISDEPKPNAKYEKPPLSCLAPAKVENGENYSNELKQNAEKLVSALKSFGVQTKIVDICRGPTVTRYELSPAAGVKISKITGLADDIALNLAASGVRIEAPIPNKAAVGIEVPNKMKSMVTLREILEEQKFKAKTAKSKLNVALGKDIAGDIMCADLAKMPHLLIAGTTGSGKSVCLNAMILSLLYNATPEEVKLVMIDPKQVEFTVYSGIPHLLTPVVSDPRKASGALAWAVKEMLNRYKMFSENNVRDIKGYNKAVQNNPDVPKMPQIVIFIDELSDLMMAAPNEVEDSICRLAQMARAAGIHLVIATQRPSVDVITGIIKANIPSRISLSVSSQVDSRTIIDMVGAEKLLGNGDMLFHPVGNAKPIRVQGCYTSDKEVEDVVEFIKEQSEQSAYDEEVVQEIERQAAAAGSGKKGGSTSAGDGDADDADVLLPKAVETVLNNGQASTTLIQRKLKVGYARAARIIDQLEERGIVGGFEGSKPRKLLITKQQWIEMNAMSSDEPKEESEEEIEQIK